jgi:hypothetical protein
MKFLKGCLITLIIFIAVCVIGWFSFENSVTKNLTELNQNVEKSWEKYVSQLKDRNEEFTQKKIENDSVEYYLKSSSNILNSKDYVAELEINEYKLNKTLMANSLKSNWNEKLNSELDNYNKTVREYNVYRVRFPNSIIARRMNFRKSYKYFDIRYGIENEKVMARKKEIENWVKNGGAYPQ